MIKLEKILYANHLQRSARDDTRKMWQGINKSYVSVLEDRGSATDISFIFVFSSAFQNDYKQDIVIIENLAASIKGFAFDLLITCSFWSARKVC